MVAVVNDYPDLGDDELNRIATEMELASLRRQGVDVRLATPGELERMEKLQNQIRAQANDPRRILDVFPMVEVSGFLHPPVERPRKTMSKKALAYMEMEARKVRPRPIVEVKRRKRVKGFNDV
jgi:hypothetical protein